MSTTATFFDALKAGDLLEVEALLGADPSLVGAKHGSGLSPVLWAAYHGQTHAAQVLVARGADLDLFEAAALGALDCISTLLDSDPAQVNGYSRDGFSALGLAAFFGHLEALRFLLSRGADPNAASKNPMQVTPLHSAVAHRQEDVSLAMARALLEHGADPNRKQQAGYTPLHQAAAHGQDAMAELLLSYGAEPSVRSAEEKTPLQMAEGADHAGTAALLRRHGAA